MVAIERSSPRNYEPAGLNLRKFIGSMLGKIRNDGAIDILLQDSLAEWSKALAPGASPQGRGFEPHSCHLRTTNVTLLLLPDYRSLVWCHKQFALVFINTYSGTCVPRWCSHIILFGVEHRLQLKLVPAPFWHARTA